MREVRVLSAEADRPQLTAFVDELRTDGFRVSMVGSEFQADGTPTVVALSDSLVVALGGKDVATARLDELGTAAIPITVGPRAYGAVWSDRSQIPIASFGVGRAARRVGLVARTGQSAIAAWNALRDDAARWGADGRPNSGLLRREQIVAAEDLIRQPVAELPDADAETVQVFVAASRNRARARRRRGAMIVAGSMVLLLIASALALVQRAESARAATAAQAQADAARADRLAGFVDAELGTDPDLPWILAADALEAAPTPKALEAAQRVLDNSIAHRSFKTRGPGLDLAALIRDRVVVGYPGGRGFDVIDVGSGVTLYEQVAAGPNDAVSVSANPSRTTAIAISTGGQAHLIDATGEFAVFDLAVNGATKAGNWLDDQHALIQTNDGMALLDASTRQARQLSIPPTGEEQTEIRAAFGDAAAGWLALGYGDRVDVWRLVSSNSGDFQIESSKANKPALRINADAPSRFALTATSDWHSARLMIDANRTVLAVAIDEALANPADLDDLTRTISTLAGAMTADGHGSLYVGSHGGIVGVIMPGADYAVDAVAAHNGPTTALDVIGDTWLSAGADYYLRLWRQPIGTWSTPNRSFGGEEALLRAEAIAGLEESRRVTMATTEDGKIVTTIPATLEVTESLRDTLQVTQNYGTRQLNVGKRTRISADGEVLAWSGTFGGTGKLVFYRHDRQTWTVHSTLDVGLTWSTNSLIALSHSGDYFAACANQGLVVWRADAKPSLFSRTDFEPTGMPVRVIVDDQGRAQCVDSSGQLRKSDGSSIAVVPTTQTLRSAGWIGGDVITVDYTGMVRRFHDGASLKIGQVPANAAGFVVQANETGTMVAIIGTRGTLILDVATGRILDRFDPLGIVSSEWPVEDVLFDGDSVILARSNGWLERREVSRSGPQDAMVNGVPRSLSEIERLAIDGPGSAAS